MNAFLHHNFLTEVLQGSNRGGTLHQGLNRDKQADRGGELRVSTIILRNQVLKATPFSAYHLPPLVPGTDGIAKPKPTARAVVCIAPGTTKATNRYWEQELDLHRGDPHQAIATDDTYPNQVFARDYTVKAPVALDDPLAVVLRDFWAARSYSETALRDAWFFYLSSFKKRKPPW